MNEEIIENIKNDLERKEYSLLQTNVALTSQGYLVNEAKENRLMLLSITRQMYGNIHLFNAEQLRNLDAMVLNL